MIKDTYALLFCNKTFCSLILSLYHGGNFGAVQNYILCNDKIIGEDLFGENGKLIKFAKISCQ